MNGAELLVKTLIAGGVDTCFANPGTSEMHFVAALDRIEGIRCVLGLFEGVVTGAADGYARMAEKPAATLLHCGPGLANGLANLHNAKRARSPMVNIVGDHATYHRQFDAPLGSDVEALARPMSHWVRTIATADAVGSDAAAAIGVARTPPGRIATLVLPADAAWNVVKGDSASPVASAPTRARVGEDAVRGAAAAIYSGEPTVLMLSSNALREGTLRLAGQIAAARGIRLMAQMSNARYERGAGRVAVPRVPYPVDQALDALAGTRHMILVGATAPVAFFAYPGKPSRLTPDDCAIQTLAQPGDDIADALERLAEAVGAHNTAPQVTERRVPALPAGALTPEAISQAIGALLPEQAIICDEAVTSGRKLFNFTDHAAPHDHLQLTGGSIGLGLPLATGAAVACPDRKVLCLEGDGSGMYTLQALWTQARENLDVVSVIFANRSYAILEGELKGVGAGTAGPRARDMLTIDRPALDWVALARGMGVEGGRATTAEEFCRLLSGAFARRGPFLIEAAI